MTVIAELIDAGLHLKQQGNLQGAIEHFRQLQATYPGQARIMFELAAAWRAFGVPEQALPLYRELLALPKSQGLPPKDMPRLYTQLGATLLAMGEVDESLAIIEEGSRLHPSYRSLRAWRIFALTDAGSHPLALLDALELMLESLAPSRWDIFEDDIKAMVKKMRANLSGPDEAPDKDGAVNAPAESSAKPSSEAIESVVIDKTEQASGDDGIPQRDEIAVSNATADPTEYDVAVNLVEPAKKKKSSRKKKPRPQMSSKAVRIDISGEADEPPKKTDDDNDAAQGGSLKIPIDPD